MSKALFQFTLPANFSVKNRQISKIDKIGTRGFSDMLNPNFISVFHSEAHMWPNSIVEIGKFGAKGKIRIFFQEKGVVGLANTSQHYISATKFPAPWAIQTTTYYIINFYGLVFAAPDQFHLIECLHVCYADSPSFIINIHFPINFLILVNFDIILVNVPHMCLRMKNGYEIRIQHV